MNIVLDTNIFASDFLMKSHKFQILKSYLSKTGNNLLVPQIVREELISVYSRSVQDKALSLSKSLNNLNRILVKEQDKEQIFDIKKAIQEYKKYVEVKFKEFNAVEIPYNNTNLEEIVRRSLSRIKPMSIKGQEFRDTLLWLSVIDHLKYDMIEEAIFISSNTKDFANENGYDLHTQLIQDLNLSNIKLVFYNSLKQFVQDHSSKIEEISPQWLVKNIDWELLDSGSYDGVNSMREHNLYLMLEARNIELDVEDWRLVDTKFVKEIQNFQVFDYEGKLYVHLFLHGECKVEIMSSSRKRFYVENVGFYTEAGVDIKNNKIMDHHAPYHIEETGLFI